MYVLILTMGSGLDGEAHSDGRGGVPLHAVVWVANRQCMAPPVLQCTTHDGTRLKLKRMMW
jgi:hypothetical protein